MKYFLLLLILPIVTVVYLSLLVIWFGLCKLLGKKMPDLFDYYD